MVRPFLAVPVYLAVAVLSFWSFGDDGVTESALVIAAALNIGFGLVFGWRFAWLPVHGVLRWDGACVHPRGAKVDW